NIAYDEEPVADISQSEIDNQDLETATKDWKDILSDEEWPKVMNVIARGGRFDEYGAGFDGDNAINASPAATHLYLESYATSRNSITGEYNKGTVTWSPQRFQDGSLLTDKFPAEEWPFKAANH